MPELTAASHAPLAEVLRGSAVESLHLGSVAVVDRRGNVLHHAGDPRVLTFTRSSLKPLQALPFVAEGGVEHFGFSTAQVALMCASHSGEPRHVDAVADMLSRCGCRAADLQCGVHAPGFYDARGELPPPITSTSTTRSNARSAARWRRSPAWTRRGSSRASMAARRPITRCRSPR